MFLSIQRGRKTRKIQKKELYNNILILQWAYKPRKKLIWTFRSVFNFLNLFLSLKSIWVTYCLTISSIGGWSLFLVSCIILATSRASWHLKIKSQIGSRLIQFSCANQLYEKAMWLYHVILPYSFLASSRLNSNSAALHSNFLISAARRWFGSEEAPFFTVFSDLVFFLSEVFSEVLILGASSKDRLEWTQH